MLVREIDDGDSHRIKLTKPIKSKIKKLKVKLIED